jgi:hypothetical protein
MGLIFGTTSLAQVDLKIMVSGPWAYVANPSDKTRILIVAPTSAHHNAYIFAGTNAASFRLLMPPSQISNGPYRLDFDSSLRVPFVGTPQKAITLLPFAVDQTKVSAILSDSSNYVISLPVPDDYSTYIDPAGMIDGYSESRVSASGITPPVPAPPTRYTTWMVLHYSVKALPVSLQQTGTASQSIATTDGTTPGGISIVLGDPNLQDFDPDCDAISLESFEGQSNLWKLTEYARFPMQDNNGKQIPGKYDFKHCSDSVPNMKALNHRKKKDQSTSPNLLSGGGADCHAAQISINNTP